MKKLLLFLVSLTPVCYFGGKFVKRKINKNKGESFQ